MKNDVAKLQAIIGIRRAVPPEPKRYAQCRNCRHVVYDDEFYMPLRGGPERSRKRNIRCRAHNLEVSLGSVCDAHIAAYKDLGDR